MRAWNMRISFGRALQGRRGAVLGDEKWVSEAELEDLITSSECSGMFLEATPQLRHMLLRHRLWEATVRAAVVGAPKPAPANPWSPPKPSPAVVYPYVDPGE